MPEGPEIRLAADEVHAALGGREIDSAWCKLPAIYAQVADLAGQRVEQVSAHGKLMLTRLEGGQTLLSHNQLYGRWFTSAAGQAPNTGRDLRLVIHNAEASAWLYSASSIALAEGEGWDHPWRKKLGPDVLDAEVTAETIAARLRGSRWAGRSLAALLLDQQFLAGPGNYIRAEVLYLAGVLPERCPKNLRSTEIERVAEAALAVSRRSYATHGIVNSDENVARLKADGIKRGDYRFWVFRRAGQGCYRCGAEIRSGNLSGRPMFWCSECQG